MSKRHFEALARAIRPLLASRVIYRDDLLNALVAFCKECNPAFSEFVWRASLKEKQ